MTDEHARFIATGYTEERWQQVLRNRQDFRLRQEERYQWQREQDLTPAPDQTTILKARIKSLEKQVKELQRSQPVTISSNREERL